MDRVSFNTTEIEYNGKKLLVTTKGEILIRENPSLLETITKPKWWRMILIAKGHHGWLFEIPTTNRPLFFNWIFPSVIVYSDIPLILKFYRKKKMTGLKQFKGLHKLSGPESDIHYKIPEPFIIGERIFLMERIVPIQKIELDRELKGREGYMKLNKFRRRYKSMFPDHSNIVEQAAKKAYLNLSDPKERNVFVRVNSLNLQEERFEDILVIDQH